MLVVYMSVFKTVSHSITECSFWLQFREQWDEDRKIELDEIAQLRAQNTTMKASISEYKEKQGALSSKVDLLERQLRNQGEISLYR